MRGFRKAALGATVLAVVLAACSSGGGSKPTIKVGSDGFYEAKLLAEIYSQALEASGYTINRDGIGLGNRKVTAAALDSGQIDLKPEYIGGGTAFYAPGKQGSDPAVNAKELQTALTPKSITELTYSPAADYNAFAVRKDTADQFKLTKMSDLTAIQDQLKFGLANDCPTNPVCGLALKSAYGLTLANVVPLAPCDTPMAQALAGKTIDVGEFCSTQSDIVVNNFVVLQDDKGTQPAENITALVRNDYLAKVDKAAFSKILNDVLAKLTTQSLLDMGKQINIDKKDIAAVAKQWLKDNGLVK